MVDNHTPNDGNTHWVIVDNTGNVIAWFADDDPHINGARSAHALGGPDTRPARARFDESAKSWKVA